MDPKVLSEIEARLAEQIIDESEIENGIDQPVEKIVIVPVANESGEIIEEPLLEEETVYPLTDKEDEDDDGETKEVNKKEDKSDKSESNPEKDCENDQDEPKK